MGAETPGVTLEASGHRPAHDASSFDALPLTADRADNDERRRLGAVLVASGRLSALDLQVALDAQLTAPSDRRRLGQVLVDLGLVTERDVAAAVADLMGLPMIDLSDVRPDPDLVRVLPRAFAVAHRVVVVTRAADRLVIALADPLNVVVLDDVRLIAGVREIDVRVATESQVIDLITRAYASGAGARAVDAVLEQLDLPPAHHSSDYIVAPAPMTDVEAAPVVRLVNAILSGALDAGASDVHIEPQQQGLRVRYRVDGVLRDVMEVPPGAANAVVSRLKIMAGLDIAERRVAAGRPHELPAGRSRRRCAGEQPAVDPRREGRPAAARQRRTSCPHWTSWAWSPMTSCRCAGSRLPTGAGADHRTHRPRQDVHVVRRPAGDPDARRATSSPSRTRSRCSCRGSPRCRSTSGPA